MKHRHFDHVLPSWADPAATFFVTICTQERGRNVLCHPDVGVTALDAVRQYHQEGKWFCSLAVLMPDHVHLLVSMSPDHNLATTVGLWKRWLAKKHAIAWQFNFFDHRLRGDESADQKARYILANPVRPGLAEREEDWPYAWIASGE